MTELLTQSEVARRLGITRQAVYMALCRGSLKSSDDYPPLMIDAAEVERYRAVSLRRQGRLGRPRKASA